jgi:hypothetical protein
VDTRQLLLGRELVTSELQAAWDELSELRKELGRTKGQLANSLLGRERDKEEIRELKAQLRHATGQLAKRRSKTKKQIVKEQTIREENLQDLEGY